MAFLGVPPFVATAWELGIVGYPGLSAYGAGKAGEIQRMRVLAAWIPRPHHDAVVIDQQGRLAGDRELCAKRGGYRQLLGWLGRHGRARAVRMKSQPEVEHWSAGRKRAKDLDDEDRERRRWPPWQPLDRERCHDQDFDDQPNLEDVSGRPFVRLSSSASDTERCDNHQQDCQ